MTKLHSIPIYTFIKPFLLYSKVTKFQLIFNNKRVVPKFKKYKYARL